jgi:hypothetical protein
MTGAVEKLISHHLAIVCNAHAVRENQIALSFSLHQYCASLVSSGCLQYNNLSKDFQLREGVKVIMR